MTDLFAQQGITFEQSSLAGTHPDTTPTPITAPKINFIPAGNDNAPIVSDAPKGNPTMTANEKTQAIDYLYGDGAGAEKTPTASPAAVDAPQPAPVNQPRDLFTEQGIAAPSVTAQNQSALSSGIPLPMPDAIPTSFKPISRAEMSQPDFGTHPSWEDQAAAQVVQDRNNIIESATKRYGKDQVDEWANNPRSMADGLALSVSEGKTLPFVHGMTQSAVDFRMANIEQKIKDGEQLSAPDLEFSEAQYRARAEEAIRGFTRGGKVAYTIASIPAWLLEFAAADGLGKVVASGAEGAIAATAAPEIASKIAGGVTRVGATTAFMPAQYVPNYAERRLNAITAVTDKGEYVLKGAAESPAMSALMAYGYTAADVAAALSGPGINKYVVEPSTKLLSTPVIAAAQQLPVGIRSAIYEAYKAIDPNASYSKIMTPAGWNSALSALGSFQVDKILRGALDYSSEKNLTFGDAVRAMPLNEDDLLVAGGLAAIHGGISTSTRIAATLMQNKGVSAARSMDATAGLSAIEKDQYVAENLNMPKSAYPQLAEPRNPATSVMDMVPPHVTPDTVYYDGDIARQQFSTAEAKEPPPINDKESVFNTYYRAMHHDAYAAEIPYANAVRAGDVPDRLNNTPLWIALNHQIPSMVDHYVNEGTFKLDEKGYPVTNGKALKATFDDFDNYFLTLEPDMKTRRADFNDFLIGRHYLDMLENAKHVLVTPEQQAKSTADMARLAEKYGDDFHFFETFGNEFVAFRKRTRDLLVGTLLTPEQRAAEDKLFPYSIPLKREITPEEHQARIAAGDYASLNPGDLLKRLKGSALPVKDIVLSTLRETARTIDFVYRNRVPTSIYNLRDFAPDQVQVTERPTVKKGTAEFQISHDPKLRQKLEQTIEFLGGDIERGETVSGVRGALGSYTPAESMVRMRIGSTEGTLAHEVGHMLDHKLGLKKQLLGDPEIVKELKTLAEDRLNSDHELADTAEGVRFREEKEKAGATYTKYIKNNDEILANMFDAYVNSPEQLAKTAPKALAAFEKIISDNEQQLGFLREIKPSTSRAVETIKKDVFGKGDLPANTVSLWKDGKEIILKVSKPMYESLSSMRPSQLNLAERIFYRILRIGSGANILKKGATSTPEFSERNVVKDTLEASVQSGVKYNPTYIPKTTYEMLVKSENYKDFIKAGGKFGSFMAMDDIGLEKAFEGIINPKSALYKIFRHPIETAERLPKASETLTRFGVYRAALDRGMSPIEAAHYELDATLQFPRGGHISKKINPFVPFFNVGLLATEKLIRAFKQDPKTMAIRGFTFLTSPSLLVSGYYLYGTDDETRKSWLEIPIDRIAAGQIPFGFNKQTGEWRYMPTPYALGYLFAGMPMLAMRQIHLDAPGDGRSMWDHLLKGFLGSISPINDFSAVIPPTIKVALEDTANFDYFRGREIYSKYKEGDATLNKDKTNPYDSATAKAIGDYFDASPALIDHSIIGLTGGLGRYALKGSDAALNAYKKSQGIAVPARPTTDADGVLAGFTMRAPEGYKSNSFQQFQANLLHAEALAAHYKNMAPGEEKAQYQKDNAQQIGQLGLTGQKGQLKVAHAEIQKISKEISGIYNDTNMSGDEKAAKLITLERQITNIARNSNKQYTAAVKADK